MSASKSYGWMICGMLVAALGCSGRAMTWEGTPSGSSQDVSVAKTAGNSGRVGTQVGFQPNVSILEGKVESPAPQAPVRPSDAPKPAPAGPAGPEIAVMKGGPTSEQVGNEVGYQPRSTSQDISGGKTVGSSGRVGTQIGFQPNISVFEGGTAIAMFALACFAWLMRSQRNMAYKAIYLSGSRDAAREHKRQATATLVGRLASRAIGRLGLKLDGVGDDAGRNNEQRGG